MLILTRKTHQRIFIGKEIILEIVEIRRGQVAIGIQAPPEVKIIREELASRQPKADSVLVDELLGKEVTLRITDGELSSIRSADDSKSYADSLADPRN